MMPARKLVWVLSAVVAGHVVLAGSAWAQTPPAATPVVPAVVNPCTGVEEGKCGTVPGCVWLPGYKIKGAPDVVGYCRTAPKPLTARRPGDPAPK